MNMSKIELKRYIHTLRARYKQCGRKQKSQILDEFCSNHGFSRKHAIRLLGQSVDQWTHQTIFAKDQIF